MPTRDEIIANLPGLIAQIRSEVQWKKPASAVRHLLKRKLRGHLSANATLEDYHNVIRRVLDAEDAIIYLYWFNGEAYPAIVADYQEELWLVMFSIAGILETAFVVENPNEYLHSPLFERIGTCKEILS